MATNTYIGDLNFSMNVSSLYDDGIIEDMIYIGHMEIDLNVSSSYNKYSYPKDWLAEVFEVERAGEQPQVKITYQRPVYTGVDKIRVRRRAYTYPVNEVDGDLIFEDDILQEGENYYSDLDVESFVPYFYACFSHTSLGWVTNRTVMKSAIPYEGNYFPDRMWNSMPDNEKVKDFDGVEAVTTVLEQAEYLGETFNITETGEEAKGQLQRFLKLIGFELDDIKGKIDLMYRSLRDPKNAPETLLPYIAALIGLNLNREFTVDRQRQEILSAVALYKKKGTVEGFLAAARLISSIKRIELVEYKDLLLCSNNSDRLSARTITHYPELYEDDTGTYDPNKLVNPRSWSDIFNPYTFELRLFVADTDFIGSITLAKIQRVIDNFSPVCTSGFVTLFPAVVEEEVNLDIDEIITDTNIDEYEEGFTVISDSSEYYFYTATFYNFDINSTVASTKTINVDGDVSGSLSAGQVVTIDGAPTSGVNGMYTVVSVTYNDPDSDIVVSENIADSTSEGRLLYGPIPVNVTNSYTSRIVYDYYLKTADIDDIAEDSGQGSFIIDYPYADSLNDFSSGDMFEVQGVVSSYPVNGVYTIDSINSYSGGSKTKILTDEIPYTDVSGEGTFYHGKFESELWFDVITRVEGEPTGMVQQVSNMGV